MAFNITGQIKIKTLKKNFKAEFGLSLRVYDGKSFADDEKTISVVRKKKGAGELSVRKSMLVGNLEDKILDLFGIKTQIAGSDDSYLCDNKLSLAVALSKDSTRISRGQNKKSNTEEKSISETVLESVELNKTFRILASRSGELELNMIYGEVGVDDYEVFGAYSSLNGGGLFHQDEEGEMTVSDDFYDFSSKYNDEDVEKICSRLEKLRAEFEEYNDDGDMLGLSEAGLNFLSSGTENDDGCVEVYSDDASDDFIYDIQDEWNLDFYKN